MTTQTNLVDERGLPIVLLTHRAAQVFKDSCMAEGKSLESSYLRIGARYGGCSGYKYELEWNGADQVKADDIVHQSNGVQVVVDKSCLTDILGPLEIDFSSDNMVEQGFKFTQLTEGSQCGCGESFTAVKDLGKAPAFF